MKARWFFAAALGLVLTGAARDGFDAWVTATVIPPLALETGAEVTARDGRLLRAWTVADGRWRLTTHSAAVDQTYLKMLIAFEDRRFYAHAGVDPIALLRAGVQSVLGGRVVSGGSTLTMQVARLLEESGTGKVEGKLRQMRLALALERQLSKPQILDLYLHLAPYGGNIEGVRAASLAWFGREPLRLTPAQAALLVALPQSPEARRPDRDQAAARKGRDRVLARATQADVITPEDYATALTEGLPSSRLAFPRLAPHLTERLLRQRPELHHQQTTLDADLQSRLEGLAAEAVAHRQDRVQVAIVAADHRSGAILASVGSAGYDDRSQGFIDLTQALRSPGSTLKPLVYAMAFDEGLAHPETLIEDRPIAFGRYQPQNFDRQFRGTVSVRQALKLSLNIPVVALTEALGPERLMQVLTRAGASPRLPTKGRAGLAVALGGVGISLQDLTSVFAGLANGGVARPLSPLPDARGEGERLTSAAAAWHVGDILSELIPPEGGKAGQIAWKTGTSYGHRDALAIGWDGAHVIGVWMGRADGTPVPGAFGADLAAPLLFQAFERLGPKRVPLPAPPPTTLQAENARLPQPLQRFRARGEIAQSDPPPTITYPPDGAEIALDGAPLFTRIQGGTPPFTWLINGAPQAIALPMREAQLPAPPEAQAQITVIDAKGKSARALVTFAH